MSKCLEIHANIRDKFWDQIQTYEHEIKTKVSGRVWAMEIYTMRRMLEDRIENQVCKTLVHEYEQMS